MPAVDIHHYSGLTSQQVDTNLKTHGYNKLPDAGKKPWWKGILNQIKSPLILFLLCVAAIALLAQEISDTVVILVVVTVNTIVGFIQERRAQKAVDALKSYLAPQAKVIRDGDLQIIDAQNLTVGDIVLLEAGDRVPADGKLLEYSNLRVNESQLTGEAFPVHKTDQDLTVFMGSFVQSGKGMFEITAIGKQTKIGQITSIVLRKDHDTTPLERSFHKLTNKIILTMSLFSGGIILVGLARGYETYELLKIALALAVSVIPEGLPVVVTITLAVGVYRMGKQNAIIRNLASASTLASTDVICTDKTGTITSGQITQTDTLTLNQTDLISGEDKTLLRYAILCNDGILTPTPSGDILDLAILHRATQAGLDVDSIRQNLPRLAEIPFDSEYKFQATMHQESGQKQLLIVKGAPEVILETSSNLSAKQLLMVHRQIKTLGEQGLRVIALAIKEYSDSKLTLSDVHKLQFLGLLVFSDPLREEVKSAIQACLQSGIQIVLVTGDHLTTAQNIATQAGILQAGKDFTALSGPELDQASVENLKDKSEFLSLIYRASPLDKVKLVELFKAKRHVVAMTGDGVNDAPALVKADIGIAMGQNGTDVARESADMVLVDNNFATIVKGIEEARVVFENLKKVITYLFLTSIGETFFITTAIILGSPLPILAAQVLWLNLITDGFLDISLAAEPKEKHIMQYHPNRYKRHIVSRFMVIRIVTLGLYMAVGAYLFFLWQMGHQSLAYAQTSAMIVLALAQWITAFTCRSETQSLFTMGFFSNRFLSAALVLETILLLSAVYTPPLQLLLKTVPVGPEVWLFALLFATSILIIEEGRKFIMRRTAGE